MLHLLFWKNLFCVLLRRSGPPAIARIIASAILFSIIQISTAASKFPVSKAWLKSPSASKVHRYNSHHKIISVHVHVYENNNNYTSFSQLILYWPWSVGITSGFKDSLSNDLVLCDKPILSKADEASSWLTGV